jgi:TRAP-type C4-dicarboxylate transport system permease small subunit
MTPLRLLAAINDFILPIGRWIAGMLIGLMTAVILYQVVMRYAFNAAPNWSEEAARFMMLWMTGLIAPSGYRWGGFVAIDTVVRLLPRLAAGILSLILLVLSLSVLAVGLNIGISEVTGFAGRFSTAALWVPLDWFGGESFKAPRSWMMMSLVVGIGLMIMVNIELILKSLIVLIDPQADVPEDTSAFAAGAE